MFMSARCAFSATRANPDDSTEDAAKDEALLKARKIAVSNEQQERILASTDIAVLDRWNEKAVTVSSAGELFTE